MNIHVGHPIEWDNSSFSFRNLALSTEIKASSRKRNKVLLFPKKESNKHTIQRQKYALMTNQVSIIVELIRLHRIVCRNTVRHYNKSKHKSESFINEN